MGMDTQNQLVGKFLYVFDKHILVIALKVAKERLTLANINHAIFFDRDFNLNDRLHAQDKIHCVSKSRPFYTCHFLVKNSTDKWVDKLLLHKRRLIALIQRGMSNDNARGYSSSKVRDIIREASQP